MDVSIIIVNHNTSRLTVQAITSIFLQVEGVEKEVIVVDSASTEDCSELSSFCDENDVLFIKLDENVGFGSANNVGASRAQGRNLFFLNPDTVLLNNAVKLLSDYLDAHPMVAACGGNLFTEHKEPAHSYSFSFPSLSRELDFICGRMFSKLRYRADAEFNTTGSAYPVAYVCGADLMMKREIFNSLSGFSPDYFLYYEESDLERRVTDAGFEVHSVPQAEIIHLEGKSFEFSEEREKHVFNGRNVYFSKHYSSFYHRCADWMNIFSLCAALLVCRLRGKAEKSRKYRFRLNLYRNAYGK